MIFLMIPTAHKRTVNLIRRCDKTHRSSAIGRPLEASSLSFMQSPPCFLEPGVTRSGRLPGAVEATCHSQSSHALKQTLPYSLIYSEWDHNLLKTSDLRPELIRKLFTEVINQVRSGVIFS